MGLVKSRTPRTRIRFQTFHPSMQNNPNQNPEPDLPVDGNDSNSQQTLLFESSPFGTVDAIVQHDGQSVHFYLNGREPFGTRACWVRNLETGPFVLDKAAVEEGRTPMLPRTHCRNPQPQPLPDPENLHVIWMEEGTGAALLENGQPIAIIPPWSGIDGFHGYATECAAESPICWPLPAKDKLHQRLARAAEFWLSFENEEDNVFKKLQTELLQTYDEQWGTDPTNRYFSIDGGRFPPRGLSVYHQQNAMIATTVGMSLCPQPNVELHCESPSQFRRIELGIQLETERTFDELEPLWQALSGLAAYPWQRLTWLGAGHTVPFAAFSQWLGEPYQYALLLADQSEATPVPLPSFRNDPVNLLWIVPITEAQRSELENGSSPPRHFAQNIRNRI